MIYQSGFKETLNEEAEIYFQNLSNSSIVFENVKDAIKFLNEKGIDGIEKWWNSEYTQQERKKFANYYVRKNKLIKNFNKLS